MKLTEFLSKHKVRLPGQCVDYLAKYHHTLPEVDNSLPPCEAIDIYRLPKLPLSIGKFGKDEWKQETEEASMQRAEYFMGRLRLIQRMRVHFGLMEDPDAQPPPEYKCKVCKDTGWICVNPEGHGTYSRCECGMAGIQESGVPERFLGGWQGFEPHTRNQEAYKAIQSYVATPTTIWDMVKNGRGIYLWGETSSGKTHMVSAGILAIIRLTKGQVSAHICDANSKLWELSPEQGHEDTLVTKLSEIKVLCLDDLASEIPSMFKLGKLRAIVNNRNAKRLSTWVTCNISPDELLERLSITDEILAKQVVDRLKLNKICHVSR